MKRNLKRVAWLTVPVLLAVGCAENRRDASVSYSPTLTHSYSATSDRSEVRAYPDASPNIDVTAPPPGATSQDWALAEEIRSLLMADRKLGNAPTVAVVKNGVVTLRGDVRNKKDRQRLHEEIARLPGVQRVDDEMEMKNPLENVPGETRNY